LQPTVGPDGKIKEPESNVLLASIENMQYAVTVDVLHTVRITQYLLFISNKELT
jgi:polypyrimidine tract-binding protein 2